MSKRDELKTLIDADSKDSTKVESATALEQTIKRTKKHEETTQQGDDAPDKIEAAREDEKDAPPVRTDQPVIYERTATENDAVQIQRIKQSRQYWIHILDVFTTNSGGEKTFRFVKGDTIEIHVLCTATEILANLKAHYCFTAVSQDMHSLTPQRLYNFDLVGKLQFANFEICHMVEAVLEGVFKYHFILRLDDVDCICIDDSCILQIV
jgi:hypothetical protein